MFFWRKNNTINPINPQGVLFINRITLIVLLISAKRLILGARLAWGTCNCETCISGFHGAPPLLSWLTSPKLNGYESKP